MIKPVRVINPSSLHRRRQKKSVLLMGFLWKLVRLVILLGISYYILYPIFTKLSLLFMAEEDIYDISVILVPKHFTMENLKLVWQHMRYPASLGRSMVLALVVTLFQAASCTLVGYGFARFQFPLKKVLFALVIFTLIVPPQTYIVPLFLRYRFFDVLGIGQMLTGKPLNLLDTSLPILINAATCMGIKNGLYVYMIRQFFRNMPKEIEEASLIDGAGYFRTFWQIMLPSATSIMITVGMLSFVWQWNDYYFLYWFMPNVYTLPKALEQLVANYTLSLKTPLVYNTDFLVDPRYALLLNSVGSLMVILPLILLYIFFQRYFMQSVERSGIVG